jgi:hypothetical protein
MIEGRLNSTRRGEGGHIADLESLALHSKALKTQRRTGVLAGLEALKPNLMMPEAASVPVNSSHGPACRD